MARTEIDVAMFDAMPDRERVEVSGREPSLDLITTANLEFRKMGPRFKPAVLEIHPADLGLVIEGSFERLSFGLMSDDHRRMMGMDIRPQLGRARGTFGLRGFPRRELSWSRHPDPRNADVVMVASVRDVPSMHHRSITMVPASESGVGARIMIPPTLAWFSTRNPDVRFVVVATSNGYGVARSDGLGPFEVAFGPAPAWVDAPPGSVEGT